MTASFKKISLASVLISTLLPLLTACSSQSATSTTTASYSANNCELFIDKVLATRPYQSHAGTYIEVYIKTLNHRLDSAIAEVGFRHEVKSAGDRSTGGTYTNAVLTPFAGSNDYWKFNVIIHNGIEPYYASYHGAFYVKTELGTYYWFNTASGGNFALDHHGFTSILNDMGVVSGNGADFSMAIPTQDRFGGYYNPANCR